MSPSPRQSSCFDLLKQYKALLRAELSRIADDRHDCLNSTLNCSSFAAVGKDRSVGEDCTFHEYAIAVLEMICSVRHGQITVKPAGNLAFLIKVSSLSDLETVKSLPVAELPAVPLRIAARVASLRNDRGLDAVRISPVGDGLVELLSTDGYRLARITAEGNCDREICLPSRALLTLCRRHPDAEALSIVVNPHGGLSLRTFSANQTTALSVVEVSDLLPFKIPAPLGTADEPLAVSPRLFTQTLRAIPGGATVKLFVHIYGHSSGPVELQLKGLGWHGSVLIAGALEQPE